MAFQMRSRLLWKALLSLLAALLIWFPLFYWLTVPYINGLAFQVEENAARTVLRSVEATVRERAVDLARWRESVLQQQRQHLKSSVDLVASFSGHLLAEVAAGTLSRNAARNELLAWLRQSRYADDGYLWAANYDAFMVAHPDPRFNQTDAAQVRDERGNLVIPPIVAQARAAGEGYARYLWHRPDQAKQEEKLTYFRDFPDWQLVIGTGVYNSDIEREMAQSKQAMIDNLRSYLHGVRLARSGYVFVIDGQQNVIVHPDSRIEGQSMRGLIEPVTGMPLGPRLIEAAKAPDQALTYYWNRPDDPDNYHYKKLSWVVYVPAYDWYLGASVYAEDLGQSGTLLGQRLMLAFLVGLLLTTVVLMAFISQLTRPILRLARLARRNAEEDWVMCPETGRGDELAELSDAFNRMVSAQQARIAELKAGEIRLRSLLDQSLVGMFVIQGERFSYVNQVFAELHGFADPAALVETVAATSLICAEDRPVVEADLRQQLAGEMGAAERIIHVRHRQGHTLEVAVSARGCEYAGAPAVIGVVVDVTARQQAERAAAQALQAAENLSRLKSEFMANMSHELRTPLHGVIGLAHVGSRARDLDSAHRYFGQILHAARLLMEMVENVLDFSLLEGRVAVVQAADFSPQVLLTELAGVWRTQAEAKGLQFELAIAATVPAQLHGDAAQARKVLNSLLSNAVKFTSSGTVQLGAAYDSGWLTVSVQDTGLGMTADEVDRLFNPFAQLDGSATRHRGGMGLGLALADRVAKLLGGEIEVSSAPGEGSRFILRLPLALT